VQVFQEGMHQEGMHQDGMHQEDMHLTTFKVLEIRPEFSEFATVTMLHQEDEDSEFLTESHTTLGPCSHGVRARGSRGSGEGREPTKALERELSNA